LKKVPAPGGLQDLTVAELKEMAKAKRISLNMTKQDGGRAAADMCSPHGSVSDSSGMAQFCQRACRHIACAARTCWTSWSRAWTTRA